MGFLISPYISFPVTGSVGTAPSSADAVAYYKFEDNAANTTVVDSVGSFNGTATSNTSNFSTTGIIGNGFAFDGINDAVHFADVGLYNSSYSVSLWYKTAGTISATLTEIVSFRGEMNMEIRETGGEIVFKIFSGQERTLTFTPAINTRYHIGVSQSIANGMKFYINGELEGTDTTTYGKILPLSSSSSGGNAFGTLSSLYWLEGEIDEAGFFDVELTADNFTYLYQNGSPGSAQQYPFT